MVLILPLLLSWALSGATKVFLYPPYKSSSKGKGKLVDKICPNYTICARFNGGANAGHTVYANGKKYVFHLLPSGMLHSKCTNIIGNGCVVDMEGIFEEMKKLDRDKIEYKNRFFISDRAQIVTKGLRIADAQFEDNKKSNFD